MQKNAKIRLEWASLASSSRKIGGLPPHTFSVHRGWGYGRTKIHKVLKMGCATREARAAGLGGARSRPRDFGSRRSLCVALLRKLSPPAVYGENWGG